MIIETSQCLMNRLAEAGLPIPETATHISIQIPIDGVAKMWVQSLLTVDQVNAYERVMRCYEFREIVPQP